MARVDDAKRTSALGALAGDEVASDGVHADRIESDRCSIAGALAALGDSWSVLVLRELFFGVRRFNDIQDDLGVSRSVLADRLARLAELGVIRAVPYQDPGSRARHEYRLTRKGVGLLPMMVALKAWGDEHVNAGHGPVSLHDRETGEEVGVELRSASGRLVPPNDIVPRRTLD
jgi:DNA-binding HxlR family transcriptional regulator